MSLAGSVAVDGVSVNGVSLVGASIIAQREVPEALWVVAEYLGKTRALGTEATRELRVSTGYSPS